MANEKHGVVRTDRLYGTDVAANLISVKYMGSGSTATDIDNGNLVVFGGLMEGEREVFKATTPSAEATLGTVALIASPEVLRDERKKNLEDFVNVAGVPARAYILHQNDIFSVTAEALEFEGSVNVNDDFGPGTTTKIAIGEKATGTKLGKVIAIEKLSKRTLYVLKVA